MIIKIEDCGFDNELSKYQFVYAGDLFLLIHTYVPAIFYNFRFNRFYRDQLRNTSEQLYFKFIWTYH